ncbi:unnamed protein product [Dibothriocephalus latus]|uniref:Uncharacterized protein n=1 Tax=Dibothriocephalus latus TaxID=60516 RepID=A0A3P7N0D1_DIBLA|nr:unnamed protein product [Dibothriocephalus latus]
MIPTGLSECSLYVFKQARASERYDQLVAKAKTLLRESCASPDKAPVSESPTDSSPLPPPTPTENRISEDPSSNSIGVFGNLKILAWLQLVQRSRAAMLAVRLGSNTSIFHLKKLAVMHRREYNPGERNYVEKHCEGELRQSTIASRTMVVATRLIQAS